MRYTLPFDDLASSATINLFKTLASILVADVAGHRCRLLGLDIGPADDTPGDKNAAISIERVADVSATGSGTAGNTVSAANMPKVDPLGINCLMTGPRDYSSEPIYAAEPLWIGGLNDRGFLQKFWDEDDAFEFHRDMLCGCLIAPRAAAVIRVSGVLLFETY